MLLTDRKGSVWVDGKSLSQPIVSRNSRMTKDSRSCWVLARMANALRFALSAAFDAQTGTVGERQRNSSFLLTAASLSETLRSLPRMGKHFRSLPAFKKLISPLLADKSVSDLRGKVLSWYKK